MEAVAATAEAIGVAPACDALSVSRASFYRWQRPRFGPAPRRRSHRALSPEERSDVLAVLHQERFVDQAPAEVYATLLDEGVYLCSERTMYRVLADNEEVRERRNQLRHPAYAKPELMATGPNGLWSWDITKLLCPKKCTLSMVSHMRPAFKAPPWSKVDPLGLAFGLGDWLRRRLRLRRGGGDAGQAQGQGQQHEGIGEAADPNVANQGRSAHGGGRGGTSDSGPQRLRPTETETPMTPLLLLLACSGDTTTDANPVDSGSAATDSGTSGTDTGTSDTEPPPLTVAVWPASPWPDSPLRPDGLSDTPTSCSWTVDGVAVSDDCEPLGEDLGLTPGASLGLQVTLGDQQATSAAVTVAPWPTLLITEATGSSVAVVSGETRQRVATVSLAGDGAMPIATAATADGASVWVSDHVSQALVRIDTSDWSVQESVGLGEPIYWVADDGPRDRRVVADQGASQLLLVGTETVALPLPAPPVSVRLQADRAWTAGRTGDSPNEDGDSAVPLVGFVARVALATDTLVVQELGVEPYWAEPHPDGHQVAVADQGADQVLIVDAESLETLATWDVPGGPTGVAWSADGARIWAALYSEQRLVELDTTDGTVLREWQLGRGTVGVFPRSDGRWLYVPVLHKDVVFVFDTTHTEADYEPLRITGVSGPRGVEILR